MGVQLEKVLAKEDENQMKVNRDHKNKKAVQHFTFFLDHSHPAPSESNDNIHNHSAEVEVSEKKELNQLNAGQINALSS